MKRANVTRDKRLREELGIDSLSLIDVAVAAEDAFGIRIPDEELEHFQTVGDVIDYIQRAMVAAGKAVPRFVAAPQGLMSAFGTKRTSRRAQSMSAFGGKADMRRTCRDHGIGKMRSAAASRRIWRSFSSISSSGGILLIVFWSSRANQ